MRQAGAIPDPGRSLCPSQGRGKALPGWGGTQRPGRGPPTVATVCSCPSPPSSPMRFDHVWHARLALAGPLMTTRPHQNIITSHQMGGPGEC